MGYNTEDLELASDFQPMEGEANFGPILTREVVGGAHIAPHAICFDKKRREFVLVDWSEGLPRHDKPGTRAVRFPHGLLHFGEDFLDCSIRLVRDQLGMAVVEAQVLHVYSYVDDAKHWHMEPIILTQVEGEPETQEGAMPIYHSIGPKLPTDGKWWGKPPFEETYALHLAHALKRALAAP